MHENQKPNSHPACACLLRRKFIAAKFLRKCDTVNNRARRGCAGTSAPRGNSSSTRSPRWNVAPANAALPRRLSESSLRPRPRDRTPNAGRHPRSPRWQWAVPPPDPWRAAWRACALASVRPSCAWARARSRGRLAMLYPGQDQEPALADHPLQIAPPCLLVPADPALAHRHAPGRAGELHGAQHRHTRTPAHRLGRALGGSCSTPWVSSRSRNSALARLEPSVRAQLAHRMGQFHVAQPGAALETIAADGLQFGPIAQPTAEHYLRHIHARALTASGCTGVR